MELCEQRARCPRRSYSPAKTDCETKTLGAAALADGTNCTEDDMRGLPPPEEE